MDPLETAFTALGVSPLVAAALEARGYDTPTSVQSALIAPELADRDVMVSSQTGSGKTVAFGLLIAPSLAAGTQATDGKTCLPQALVITPTRELAAQVKDELSWLFAPLKLRVLAVTGGTSVVGELRALAHGADVVVATPGRLNDHLTRGAISGASVRTVVLDEADEMLDMGFRDELEAILQTLPEDRRTVMLSATFPPAIVSLAKRYLHEPARVAVDPPGSSNENISWVAHLVPPHSRFDALVNLLLEVPDERTLVFVRTRAEAADMGSKLNELGFGAAPLTGEMAQRDRTHTLDGFRSGRITTLIATDVAARGIDVPEVGRVIHADLPGDASTLTHRSGRTGRAGRKGISVLLVPPFARGRANEMLRAAGARAVWRGVPTAEEIEGASMARLRARIVGDDAPAPKADLLGLAEMLLADGEAPVVLARVLAEVKLHGPCAPRNVQTPPPRKERERDGRDGAFAPRERGEFDRGDRGERGDRGDKVAFRVNFGLKDGATPSRLLAMLCRRGDVRGTDIGGISIGPSGSTFGVNGPVADAFARSASRPDPRDPEVQIERSQGGGGGERPAAPRGDRPYRAAAPKARENSFDAPPPFYDERAPRRERDRDRDRGAPPPAPPAYAPRDARPAPRAFAPPPALRNELIHREADFGAPSEGATARKHPREAERAVVPVEHAAARPARKPHPGDRPYAPKAPRSPYGAPRQDAAARPARRDDRPAERYGSSAKKPPRVVHASEVHAPKKREPKTEMTGDFSATLKGAGPTGEAPKKPRKRFNGPITAR